jgi:hypothetical protein
VSHNLDDKQQMAKTFMPLSTSKCSTFEPNDDLPYNTSNTLIAQHTPILSDSQIGFMLSAPLFSMGDLHRNVGVTYKKKSWWHHEPEEPAN